MATTTTGEATYDLIVVGGGLGGLATAGLARARGLSVAILEAHTKLGGCAGYFERGPYTFDAGATALMGLAPGEPLDQLIKVLDLDFEGVSTPSYRVHLPDRTLDVVPDPAEFERNVERVFPGNATARRLFWRFQAFVGSTLFAVACRRPRFPLRSVGDLAHDLRILGLPGLLAAGSWTTTTLDVLRLFGLADDRPFRALIAMLLQDTAQAGPETVPFANAAACLHAYRAGMSRPKGGMKALVEGIGRRFEAMGGDLFKAALVDSIAREGDGFVVSTRRRRRLRTRKLALNLPIDLAAKLLKTPLEGKTARIERRARATWSAFTAYLAFDRAGIPDDGPLFHQVLQDYDKPIHDGNNVLISLSPLHDQGYGPESVRVATLSTHVDPAEWAGLDDEAHAEAKADYADRLLKAVDRALPNARASLVHSEFATPRSFERYTRRTKGAVGGPPVRRSNSVFFAAGPDVFGRDVRLVGDSVFPGQGTMAVMLSAMRAVDDLAPTSPATRPKAQARAPRSAVRSPS